MKITRIYNDSNGNSHFEDVAVALSDYGAIGFLSQNIKVSQLQFRKVVPEYDYDFHCAPQKQYIVLLDGGVEIETSLGQKRVFQSGEVLWVEDTIGKGHKTKNLEHKERTSLFIHID
ncbi:hypothetical protein OZ664_02730 [Elizabethkingia sp. HX WHF]|uniref:hypothetical protein n=1 Tax=Elizabethkingia TaxID=308865 RepID=UPI00099A8D1E|nr:MULTISPECIES: hypothetical protein [Elizabethkingia]ATL42279.1 hypothetical protein CQS02_02660 [Elizabethkingia miricola]MCL1638990.1 hypothetical protein [Elizabethkingia bruuniana]MDX8562900.1 hypothetical protein [Elizabethkingia sp. HX WHF]OPC22365.1 hypothetical protein BAY00_17610 [Elizabethkingia bruuniana]